jgi:hypothetical protein
MDLASWLLRAPPFFIARPSNGRRSKRISRNKSSLWKAVFASQKQNSKLQESFEKSIIKIVFDSSSRIEVFWKMLVNADESSPLVGKTSSFGLKRIGTVAGSIERDCPG